MRIIRYYEHGDASVLRVEESDRPVPGPGEALIRVEAIGVNFADVQKRQGIPMGGRLRLPGAPGGDIVGVVEVVGEGVPADITGSRVVTSLWGNAYADYAVADVRQLLPVPDGVTPAEATALSTPVHTAYHALMLAGRMAEGETVLVDAAAGGVGHLALQIAKAKGAGSVIATAGGEAKLNFARALGANFAFDYTKPNWAQQVLDATNGKGVDVVLETVGNEILTQSLGVLATFGRLVFYGAAGAAIGSAIPQVDMLRLIDMKVVSGFSLHAVMTGRPDIFEAGQRDIIDLVASGLLKPVVYAELPLEEAAKAHALMEARSQLGKVVLIP